MRVRQRLFSLFQFATQGNIFLEHRLVGMLQFPDPGFHGRSRFVIHGNVLHLSAMTNYAKRCVKTVDTVSWP
jgi:hypothetical protein